MLASTIKRSMCGPARPDHWWVGGAVGRESSRLCCIRRGLMSQDPTVCQDSALPNGSHFPRLVPCRAEGAVLSDRSSETVSFIDDSTSE